LGIYLTINRTDGMRLFEETLDHLASATQTLKVTDQARNWALTAWLDENDNGVYDAGEDSREVDVHVVKPWTAQGTWTAGQAALVEANADGASLEQLALDITGVASDSRFLSHPDQIRRGTLIDVTPLLQVLEMRVRQNVVGVATPYFPKNASFSSGKGANNYNEAQVRSVFEGGSGQDTTSCSCMPMVNLEMAWGLISQLRAREFDAMGLTPDTLKQQYWTDKTGTPLSGLELGDYVRFWNNEKYGGWTSDGLWDKENTIKTGPDSYYGWDRGGGKTTSDAGWRWRLCSEYNGVCGFMQGIGDDDVPGYTYSKKRDLAGFLDIPKLAQKIFNLRTGQTP
jgi:hypothetical protein